MQIEPNTFICADSIEVLREIQDKAFDLCLTDPPYGINITAECMGNRQTVKPDKSQTWDLSAPEECVFNELFRISKNQVLWGGNYFKVPQSRYFAIWDKGETMYGRDFAEAEYAWVRSGGTRIIKINPVQLDRVHPTQKPIALFVWCLLKYSKPGDFIIDPFCGSGTTAIACHRTGRKFLCIDKDEEYIKIAQQRYADEIAQQDLFKTEDGAQNTSEGRGTDVQHPQVEMRLEQ